MVLRIPFPYSLTAAELDFLCSHKIFHSAKGWAGERREETAALIFKFLLFHETLKVQI
jgi:hypothetical protein